MLFQASPFLPPAHEGLFVWAPKGGGNEEEQRTRSAFRRPKGLRPLTLQNEDRKSLAGIVGHSILPIDVSSCSVLQRGFVPGRHIVQNANDLNYLSRKHASQLHGQANFKYPDSPDKCLRWCLEALCLTVLFHFAAALPSVAHTWIWALSFAIKTPQGLLTAFKVLYRDHEGMARVSNICVWIFLVKCGVLQGCPSFGTLVVMAIDPSYLV